MIAELDEFGSIERQRFTFDEEREVFDSEIHALLENHSGGFVVISGLEIIGVHMTKRGALIQGLGESSKFMIKRIQLDERDVEVEEV